MSARVLYVNTPTYIGGSEVSILTLMSHLSRDRYAPHLLTSGEGPLLRRSVEMGMPSYAQGFPWFSRRRPWKYLSSIWQLSRTIRRLNIDLVHTNCDHSLPYVMRAANLCRVPYVSHVRDTVRSWFQPAALQALKQAAAVIVSSKAMANACTDAGVRASSVRTIYNPVDVDAFRAASPATGREVRERFDIPSDALVIGLVGQVIPLKGHAEFVEVGLGLAGQLPNVHFLIVGSAPPSSQYEDFLHGLRARIVKSEYSNRFHFTGFREDIPAVMKSIDILAVPSWSEPFGRVAVEGMAAGCAVVGSAVDGLPEIIVDGVNGLLVPPRNVSALARAVYRLAIDSDARRHLSRQGIRAAARFAVARHVDQVQALYDSVLCSRPLR